MGYAAGIEIHPNGYVYAIDAGRGHVMRVDPYSGEIQNILKNAVSWPNGISFSADYSKLYIGNESTGIYSISVDKEGIPTGGPELIISGPDGAGFTGLGVDACENIYAVTRDGASVMRYSADGTLSEQLFEVKGNPWMTNLQWGSGLGGFEETHLFITDRSVSNSGIYELDIGVGGKPR